MRFGSVPVDEAPLGWEVVTRERQTKVTRFQHAYPVIRLPFQEVQRVDFGHKEEFLKQNEKDPKLKELFPTGANRLFFGDCLHVMRQLPSNSIDLIYIDPPFFSGRVYNMIFGDKNEVRSFNDIWEGGMPGYLVWLNARLYEMKRLLKANGTDLLSFVQPPESRINVKRTGKLKYEFDVSESVSLNKDGVLANVQWDFNYRERFSTTPGYAFLRDKKTGRAQLLAEYEFPLAGRRKIACSVQDDQGGEKTVVTELDVR